MQENTLLAYFIQTNYNELNQHSAQGDDYKCVSFILQAAFAYSITPQVVQ